MIGVPEAFSIGRADAPIRTGLEPGGSAKTLEMKPGGKAVDTAAGANSPVALQDLFAKIAGIGAEAPFFDAPVRTERLAALGNFEIAPAAEAAAIWTFGELVAIGPTAWHRSLGAHPNDYRGDGTGAKSTFDAFSNPLRGNKSTLEDI